MHVSDRCRWNRCLDALHGAWTSSASPGSHASSLKASVILTVRATGLTDYVVMPNHVHLLAAFPDEDAMLTQCESWKHYTAGAMNRVLGRKGRFWQQDEFDHLVRSADAFDHFRRYIADNPLRRGSAAANTSIMRRIAIE